MDGREEIDEYIIPYKRQSIIHNLQSERPVQELVQSALQRLDLEPVRVEGHHVRGLVLLVVPGKVLLQPLKHVVGIVIDQHALIQVRTVAALVALHVVHVQRQLPHTWILTRGASATLALVRHLVVQRVRPDGDRLWWHRDGAVVDVTEILQDLHVCRECVDANERFNYSLSLSLVGGFSCTR